jgi:hypothetical protein
MALGVTVLAIIRRLQHRFLGCDFGNRIGAVMAEAVEGIYSEKLWCDDRHCDNA